MKLKTKIKSLALLALAAVFLLSGCYYPSQHEINDKEGYTVSVKFDANGGRFTAGVYSFFDVFKMEELPVNSNGMAEIRLIAPDSDLRGEKANIMKIENTGYMFLGWYQTRNEVTDAEGNVTYTYSDKWDFETSVFSVDPNGTYSSADPVMTLYAAWSPKFEIHIYDITDNKIEGSTSDEDPAMEPVKIIEYNPFDGTEFKMPQVDSKTGGMKMFDFPKKEGYTFVCAYTDAAKQNPITESTIKHPGVINPQTGEAENSVLNIYVDYREGNWFKISSEAQLRRSYGLNYCYELIDDIDFEGKIWPSNFTTGDFKGKIIGNGHTIKNVTVYQDNLNNENIGLFGHLSDSAEISDVVFENITLSIEEGSRVPINIGLLAGSASAESKLNNIKILNSKIQILSSVKFHTDAYYIGLVFGNGDTAGIDYEGQIQCETVGEENNFTVNVNGNSVELDYTNAQGE